MPAALNSGLFPESAVVFLWRCWNLGHFLPQLAPHGRKQTKVILLLNWRSLSQAAEHGHDAQQMSEGNFSFLHWDSQSAG
ncbi:MAG: hypothetical protein JPMHGGIA_01719 [Saprospiraceae bacterium]|jgi:hypothetical protein|nr:hypothetical protein [Saprospiraceae bacterium]